MRWSNRAQARQIPLSLGLGKLRASLSLLPPGYVVADLLAVEQHEVLVVLHHIFHRGFVEFFYDQCCSRSSSSLCLASRIPSSRMISRLAARSSLLHHIIESFQRPPVKRPAMLGWWGGSTNSSNSPLSLELTGRWRHIAACKWRPPSLCFSWQQTPFSKLVPKYFSMLSLKSFKG